MIELTAEYKEAARKFKTQFGYGVPLAMIPPRTETAELIQKILGCVDRGVDDLLDSYQVQLQKGELV